MENKKIRRRVITAAAISFAAAVLAVGCAKTNVAWDKVTNTWNRSSLSNMISRGAGEKRMWTLEQTRNRLSCPRNMVQLVIERSHLSPDKVAPGDHLRHFLEYALCAPSASATVQGRVTRRIWHNRTKILEDADTRTFKAGTWRIAVVIEVPDKAQDGEYLIETTVNYNNDTITRRTSFYVHK